jgi:predicted ATPase
MLVLLDNCEHVLGAAAECAEAIVDGGTSVVLATSREPLGIAGEQVLPVPSLVRTLRAVVRGAARAVDPRSLSATTTGWR